ncbi:SH3 beta-barrel fold-containing protein [bacterium]|jgi:hypothetical protein|nr:SH3 beta-barrel fold-containing protein [bacterium]
MYSFIEYIAAIESKNFNTIDEEKIEWARNFVQSIIDNLDKEVHKGDCTNDNYPCNLCVLEGMLIEYRRYVFNINNKIMINIEELRKLLKFGKISFEYTKNNGDLRKAIGTLQPELIPESMKPKDSSTQISTLRYFDLDKNEWRSISKNIKEITII